MVVDRNLVWAVFVSVSYCIFLSPLYVCFCELEIFLLLFSLRSSVSFKMGWSICSVFCGSSGVVGESSFSFFDE